MPGALLINPFLSVLLLLSLQRLVFYIWNYDLLRSQEFSQVGWAFLHGVRFDVATLSALTIIPFLLAAALHVFEKMRWVRGLVLFSYWMLLVPLFLVNAIDIEFFNFLGRRTTFDSLVHYKEAPGKLWPLVSYYWLLTVLGVIALVLMTKAVFRRRALAVKIENMSFVGRLIFKTAGFLGLLLLLIVGARGGLQKKPIGFAHAQIFPAPVMNTLVMNSGFTILQTVKRETLPRDQFFKDRKEMFQWLNGSVESRSLLEGRRPKTPQNIMLIVLESFSLEYLGRPYGGKGHTPFLDELSRKGVFLRNFFANGRRSIEGIGAIIGGIPALMNEPFISSQYLTNQFLGLGTLVAAKGYHTSFFHGAQNGTMYFDQFMRSAGVDHYFGLNEYPVKEDFDGIWGIWDHPFLQWTANKISTFPEPFMSCVFTLSSHHPFKVPPSYQDRFPKADLDILPTIAYTDWALSEFFSLAAKQSWYKNTLFIITADHTFKSYRGSPKGMMDSAEIRDYRIPLILFHPSKELPKLDEDTLGSQIDILPTVLDYLNISRPEQNFLGRSLFEPGPRSVVNLLESEYLVVGDRSWGLWKRPDLFTLKGSLSMDRGQHEDAENLEKRTKATLQYFSEGLWDNKLYYPSR